MKVTIRVTETFTYEVDDASNADDAISEAFRYRGLWSYEYDSDEYNVSVEVVSNE